MKLYRAMGPRGYIWWNTQVEAKTGAKGLGVSFEPIEVPTTPKEEFVNWLNDQVVMSDWVNQLPDPIEQAEQRAVMATTEPKLPAEFEERRAAAVARQQDTDGLIDWMETAEPWQLERIFEAIASRLGELFGSADRQ